MKSKPKSSPEDVIHSHTHARAPSAEAAFFLYVCVCILRLALEIHKMMIIPKKFSSAGSTSGSGACIPGASVAERGKRARTIYVRGEKLIFSPRGAS